MGKIINEEEQLKKGNVIQTDSRSKEALRDQSFMPDINMNDSSILNRNVSLNEIYFERIIQNSADRNTAFRVRVESELEKNNWSKAGNLSGVRFSQQYPAAVKDRFFGSSENRKIKDAKRIFRNADLCTVRERAGLEQLFASNGYKAGVVGTDAKNEIFDPDLKHYVNFLVKNELKPDMLTDDYLSKNIATVYELTRKLLKYNEIKEQYPAFFSSIPETKKIVLERMAAYAGDLNVLLNKHLYLHGLVIDKDQDGDDRVSLRREPENKTERHQQRQQLKNEYDQQQRAFLIKAFANEDYELAKQFTNNQFLNESEDLIKVLEEQFKEGTEVRELFGVQIEKAIEEIRSTLAVRDELVEDQKDNLEQKNKGTGKSDKIRRSIRHTNDKLMLCSEHIDHYKQYLYFLNGNIGELREETVSFLIREKQTELLEPVKFKASLQCTEDALALTDRLDKKDPGVRFKPKKLTGEQFYEKYRFFDDTKKKRAQRREADRKWKENVADTAQKAKEYADKNHLKPTSGKFYLGFKDPHSEYLKGDSYFYIYLASNYMPTDETPENVKTDIAEKGIRPWLNMILETQPGDYMDHVIKKDEDFSSKGYYEKYARMALGLNSDEFLKVLENYDINLEDDDFLIIKTYGRVMQGAVNRLDYVSEKISIPILNVLGSDERIFKESDRIRDILSEKGRLSNDPEAKKLRKKYSKLLTGIEIDAGKLPGGMKASPKSVPDYLSVLFMTLSAVKTRSYADDVDLEEEFYFFLDQEKKKGVPKEDYEGRNRQLRDFNALYEKEEEAGRSTVLYKNIQDIEAGRKKGLDENSRAELKALLEKKDVKALTPERKAAAASDENYDNIRNINPWVDKKTGTVMAKLSGLITDNLQRIEGSDELYKTLCEHSDDIEGSDPEELKGKIKAHTDRILSMKLDKTTLNEKYMVEHIDQFVEYLRALSLTSKMRKVYPGLLDALPIADQIRIKLRSESVFELEMLIDSLMGKYGMKLLYNSSQLNGAETWSDVRISLLDNIAPSKQTSAFRKGQFDDALKAFTDAVAKANRNKEKQAKLLVEESDKVYVFRLMDEGAIERSLKQNKELYNKLNPVYDRLLESFKQTASEASKALQDTDSSLKAKEPGFEVNARKALGKLSELEKFKEIFDFASGRGSIPSSGAEKLLETKNLMGEYSMILANVVVNKVKG